MLLHQLLQALGERGLAATDRAEQIENLLPLLEPLSGVPEEADNALDRLLEPIEVLERLIDLHRPIEEDAAEANVLGGVDEPRLADGGEHALGGRGVQHRIALAAIEVLLQRQLALAFSVVALRIELE